MIKNFKEYIIISIILVISLFARLYRIDSPLADWHSWRQADTSAVTRRFVEEGIDLLRPRYDDLSDIPSGKKNPQGFRFVEFPFINALTALVASRFPSLSIEIWGRLTSIMFSLGAVVLVYLLGKSLSGQTLAITAAAVFGFLPYNLFFHRTILPEVPLLFFSLALVYAFQLWIFSGKLIHLGIATLSGMLALLLKPFVVFLIPPLAYLAFRKWGWRVFKEKWILASTLLIVIPFLLWRAWAAQFPEGIPAYTWLLNGTGIRFRPAFFRWIFAERFAKLIMGYWGTVPFAFGLIRKPEKQTGWFFHWWFVGSLLYLVIFATGNVTHDYYQIFIIPSLAFFIALGIQTMMYPPAFVSKWISRTLLLLVLIFGWGFSWYEVRDFFNINHPEIVSAGQTADKLLTQDAKVIAPYGGDTAFLYQVNRHGWPIGGNIEEKVSDGATDYVSVNRDEETLILSERCQPTLDFGEFVIVSLRHCNL